MLKLYRYTCGGDERVGAAEDDLDAYERRSEVDSTYHFLPVEIEELTLPGYEIEIRPITGKPPDFEAMETDQLRAWLDARGARYHSQFGERKLREVCRTVAKEQKPHV